VNGDLPVNENDIVELIALDLQYTYGAYDKKKKYGFMSEKYIFLFFLGFIKHL